VALIAAATCLIALTVPSSHATKQARASLLEGRWVIEANPWFDETYGGTGRAGGAVSQAGRGDIILVLRLTPSGGVAGTASGLVRGLGAPGNQPQPDIEISRGELRGGSLIFEIWRYDGHHNRLRVEARPDATGLVLTFSRARPNGPPATYTTRATRASY
jgi:hypothetical protein